jgi:hypothetical protein
MVHVGFLLLFATTANAGKGKGFRHFRVAHVRRTLSSIVVFGLGEGMTFPRGIEPSAVHIRTAFLIKFIKVLEFERLTDILLVILVLLGLVGRTDLLVLGQGQTRRHVRIGRDLARFQLYVVGVCCFLRGLVFGPMSRC